MSNTRLTTVNWRRILEILRSDSSVYVKDEAECRKFIEAIVWINRTGAPWRDLPEKFCQSKAYLGDSRAGSKAESGSGCMSTS